MEQKPLSERMREEHLRAQDYFDNCVTAGVLEKLMPEVRALEHQLQARDRELAEAVTHLLEERTARASAELDRDAWQTQAKKDEARVESAAVLLNKRTSELAEARKQNDELLKTKRYHDVNQELRQRAEAAEAKCQNEHELRLQIQSLAIGEFVAVDADSRTLTLRYPSEETLRRALGAVLPHPQAAPAEDGVALVALRKLIPAATPAPTVPLTPPLTVLELRFGISGALERIATDLEEIGGNHDITTYIHSRVNEAARDTRALRDEIASLERELAKPSVPLTPELAELMRAAVAWRNNQTDIEAGKDDYDEMESADDAAWDAMSKWAESDAGRDFAKNGGSGG